MKSSSSTAGGLDKDATKTEMHQDNSGQDLQTPLLLPVPLAQ